MDMLLWTGARVKGYHPNRRQSILIICMQLYKQSTVKVEVAVAVVVI